jgi:hypothetical protein
MMRKMLRLYYVVVRNFRLFFRCLRDTSLKVKETVEFDDMKLVCF